MLVLVVDTGSTSDSDGEPLRGVNPASPGLFKPLADLYSTECGTILFPWRSSTGRSIRSNTEPGRGAFRPKKTCASPLALRANNHDDASQSLAVALLYGSFSSTRPFNVISSVLAPFARA